MSLRPASKAGAIASAALLILIASFARSVTTAQGPAPLPGVFTADQADRGRQVYLEGCASCHGARLNDGASPALSRR